MEIGIRIQTLRQMFNVKHGIDPIQFKMHGRMSGNPPLKEGPLAGITLDIEALMKGYWKAFGWDAQTGVPTDETKEALELNAL
jgi:aldehyde:ferredoxin oxidoreductase